MMESAIKKQRGAVLAFCLVMLTLLTIAGTRMIQQNKQQLEMANSMRLVTQEFANAEGLLAEAKNVINDHPAHDNYYSDDNNSIDNTYFPTLSKLPVHDTEHQCTPTTSAKQNILLAGTALFSTHSILNGKASILDVRCLSESGTEQICSSYTTEGVKCHPKSGDEDCSGVTLDDDITIEKFNSTDELCYQIYDPQANFTAGESYTGKNTKCPKEVYKIQVISTDTNGTTRQIISDYVVGCG